MSQALVEQIKNELVSKGVDLRGPCGAFEITKRVAWGLRSQGYGLAYKGHTGGNDCEGYSVDTVMKPDGTHWDILGSSGDGDGIHDGNKPQFNLVVYTADDPDPAHKPLIGQPFKRPEMYRPAFNWLTDDKPPVEEPPPPEETPPILVIAQQLTSLSADILAMRAEIAMIREVQSWGVGGKVPYLGNAQFLPIPPKKERDSE